MATKAPLAHATAQELIDALAPDEKDIADVPMKGNKLSPKETYKAIKNDMAMLKGTAPSPKYPTANRDIKDRLEKDSDVGRFASPGIGDMGQFAGSDGMKKGGKVRSSASKRADGIATKGHTKGRYI